MKLLPRVDRPVTIRQTHAVMDRIDHLLDEIEAIYTTPEEDDPDDRDD